MYVNAYVEKTLGIHGTQTLLFLGIAIAVGAISVFSESWQGWREMSNYRHVKSENQRAADLVLEVFVGVDEVQTERKRQE